MTYVTKMTEKMEITIVLYAQNFTYPAIAEKQGVCLTTIRERVRRIRKKYPKEFANALALRMVYKRNRDAIRDMTDFQSHRRTDDNGREKDFEEFVSEGHNGVKIVF